MSWHDTIVIHQHLFFGFGTISLGIVPFWLGFWWFECWQWWVPCFLSDIDEKYIFGLRLRTPFYILKHLVWPFNFIGDLFLSFHLYGFPPVQMVLLVWEYFEVGYIYIFMILVISNFNFYLSNNSFNLFSNHRSNPI